MPEFTSATPSSPAEFTSATPSSPLLASATPSTVFTSATPSIFSRTVFSVLKSSMNAFASATPSTVFTSATPSSMPLTSATPSSLAAWVAMKAMLEKAALLRLIKLFTSATPSSPLLTSATPSSAPRAMILDKRDPVLSKDSITILPLTNLAPLIMARSLEIYCSYSEVSRDLILLASSGYISAGST